ncbi:MAG: hypothetical protein NTU44_05810 [Bacteroidetes bacterium]|nr:hypothetical protein [Bacteroidota bacterium]
MTQKTTNNQLVIKQAILLLFQICFLSSLSLSGQNSWKFENYGYLNSGLRQSFTLNGRHAMSEKFGFNSYVTVKDRMGGGALGFDYTATPWLNLGLLGGYDIQLSSVSLISFLGIKREKISFTAAYLRIGEVLDLFELALMYNGRYVKAGAIARNYFGVGPRIDLRIPKTDFWLWTAGLYEWKTESYGLMLGLVIPYPEVGKK